MAKVYGGCQAIRRNVASENRALADNDPGNSYQRGWQGGGRDEEWGMYSNNLQNVYHLHTESVGEQGFLRMFSDPVERCTY